MSIAMRIPASELSWVLEWEAIKGEKGRKEIGSRGKLKEVTAVEMKRTVAVKEGSKGTFETDHFQSRCPRWSLLRITGGQLTTTPRSYTSLQTQQHPKNADLLSPPTSNEDLCHIATNMANAYSWVHNNIRNYANVNFRYIAVGNEIHPPAWEANHLLGAMKNIHRAISEAGLGNQIKVSTPFSTEILGESYPPSKGSFKPHMESFINPIIRFLVDTHAPFFLNMYTYFSYIGSPHLMSLEYALFTSPGVVVHDGQFGYQNMFDAVLDAAYSALEKAGGGSLEIVVAETGWPSAGGLASTVENARTYNTNLLRHVKGGTPKRPGKPIQTYLFSMFNENKKEPAFEKNWGLFYPNKQPVYHTRN
ncbi:hypothetical protein AAG906_036310 [Vitis piasezkii]